MAPRAGQKEEGKARILDAAGRGFRRHGYGGLGIDGLAREAGVTSGAFYAHFKSKAAAFREAVTAGVGKYRQSIEAMQKTKGEGWRRHLIDYYMGARRTCDLADSCALQSLTGDVARAGDEAREAFQMELENLIASTAAGIPGEDGRAKATALLALLAGGVSMARAVKDPGLAEEIAEAVRQAAIRLDS